MVKHTQHSYFWGMQKSITESTVEAGSIARASSDGPKSLSLKANKVNGGVREGPGVGSEPRRTDSCTAGMRAAGQRPHQRRGDGSGCAALGTRGQPPRPPGIRQQDAASHQGSKEPAKGLKYRRGYVETGTQGVRGTGGTLIRRRGREPSRLSHSSDA